MAIPNVLLSAVTLALFGCSGAYCQSGPKYGSQCYSEAEIQQSPGSTPERDGRNPSAQKR